MVVDVLNGLNRNKIEDGTRNKKAYLDWHDRLTCDEFRAVLEKVDSGLRALPATAQVWRAGLCGVLLMACLLA